jgi:putative glycerol-1-phosphate prenyltransferase
MSKTLLAHIRKAKSSGKKLFAILIDPDTLKLDNLHDILDNAEKHGADMFFIGGSLVMDNKVDEVINLMRAHSDLPLVLFPGDINQLSDRADAVLLLSLISGRNADLLIGKHVISAPFLKQSNLEIIPTGYLLIDGGNATSASYISNTLPIPSDKADIASCTAMAGEMLGLKLIYMDAGSGAKKVISKEMIRTVNSSVDIPLIIGGGIDTPEKMYDAFESGADLVVIGNAFEKNPDLISSFKKVVETFNVGTER